MMEEHWDSRMREVETSDEETDSDHSGKGRVRRDPYAYDREMYHGGHPGHAQARRGGPMGIGGGGGGYIDDYGMREEMEYPGVRRAGGRGGEGSGMPANNSKHSAHHPPHDHIDGASSSSARSSEASHEASSKQQQVPAKEQQQQQKKKLSPPKKERQEEKIVEKEEEEEEEVAEKVEEEEEEEENGEQNDPDRGDGELLLTFLMSVRKQHGPKEAKQGEGAVEAPQRKDEDGRSEQGSGKGGHGKRHHSDQHPVVKKRKA